MGISAQTVPLNRATLDHVGATASLACAVHCVAVALLLGGMPAASTLAAPWVDWAFLGVSTGIGLLALVPGYRRHGRRVPLALFAIGLAILLSVRALQLPPSIGELTLVSLAAGALVLAHWKNRGALHQCACGPHHH
jgi:MerC mercury resistance protein